MFCTYEYIHAIWSGIIARAQQRLRVDLPLPAEKAAEKVQGFLQPGHRHHHYSTSSVVDDPLLAEWLRSVFRVFDDWATAGEKEQDRATLDRVRREFDLAGPAFATLVEDGRRDAQRGRELEQLLRTGEGQAH